MPSPGVTQPYTNVNLITKKKVEGFTTAIGTTQVIILTCPANKKITLTHVSVEGNGGGANGSMEIRINTIALDDITILNEPFGTLKENVTGNTLEAGDTVNFIGDNAANNGAAEYLITYDELPG